MMPAHDPRKCPECGTYATKVVHTEDFNNEILERTRVCDDCQTQFTVTYYAETKEVDE